jgi:hypothetical protein
MITEGKPYFLSRPRRFGKSLMVDTLACIFEGRRELFEAFTTEDGTEQPQLFIATTNWKWEKHPVLRFDFSAGDLENIGQLDALIDYMLFHDGDINLDAADCNQDNEVTIADVSALVDYLLNQSW